MLRVQRNSNDRPSPPLQQQQLTQQQQHNHNVTLAPRPLFHDAPMGMPTPMPLDDSFEDDGSMNDSVSQLRPQHQLHHHHHARLSHSAKARKIKSAGGDTPHSHSSASFSSGNGGGSGLTAAGAGSGNHGRKVLKHEVTQLQQMVDGMQQQVNAATREIIELRNMVGLMVEENARQYQQQQQQIQQQQAQIEEQSPDTAMNQYQRQQQQEELACSVAPLMDIYEQSSVSFSPGLTVAQQNDLTEHFAYGHSGGESASSSNSNSNSDSSNNGSDDAQNAFYCKMEQALLCDDDDYPLFFQN